MDKIEEIKEEWEDMMEDRKKMEEMMKDIPMKGMEDIMIEWEKMAETMDKLQEMMARRQM